MELSLSRQHHIVTLFSPARLVIRSNRKMVGTKRTLAEILDTEDIDDIPLLRIRRPRINPDAYPPSEEPLSPSPPFLQQLPPLCRLATTLL